MQAHRRYAFGQKQFVFQVRRAVSRPRLVHRHRLTRSGVNQRFVSQVLLFDALNFRLAVQKQVRTVNFAGGQIPILDALRDVVFIHRLAEVLQVVGGDLLVRFGLFGPFRDF